MKFRYNSILFLCLGLLMSCIDENPNLVNPPSQKESENVRFINYSGDKAVRFLNLNSTDFLSAEFGFASKAVNPPSDSVVASITNSGVVEFKYPRKIRFVRSTFTTFLSLPSPKGAIKNKATDTLISFSSSSGIPIKTVYSYLKLFNAYPDTSVNFSVIDGCPNGTAIFTNQLYRSVSSQKQLRSGQTPVSIIKNTAAGREIIGLYNLDLKNDKQYTIILSENTAGDLVVNLLDESNTEANALSQPSQIYEKIAFIRTINLSSEALNIKKAPDEVITPNLLGFSLGAYDQVGACGSQTADSIVAEYSGFIPVANTLSLNVNERYNYLVSDTKTKRAGFGMIISEAVVDYQYPEQALIRVINADDEIGNIVLSIAGRSDSSAAKLTSGETLTRSLQFGKMSEIYPIYLGNSPKTLPLTLFAATSPAQLILTTQAVVEPGKSYLMIVKKNPSGNSAIYLVEDSQQSLPMTELTRGQFYQFVNYLTGMPSVNFSCANILNNASIKYSLGVASVANLGQTDLNIGGKTVSMNLDADNSKLIVACGNYQTPDIEQFTCNVPKGTLQFSRRRFINAASDIPELMVVLDSEKGDTTARGITYKTASDYHEDLQERSYSLFFYNSSNSKLVYRLNEVKMIHGKIYSFVLGGNAQIGYSVNIVQEY